MLQNASHFTVWARAPGLLAAALLCTAVGGCSWIFPEDGPHDPFRCDPPCTEETLCRDGICVPRVEAGAPDLQRDQGSAEASIVCGNGTLDPGEDCDGDDKLSKTCVQGGFTAGNMGCTSSCAFDQDGCVKLLSSPASLDQGGLGATAGPVASSDNYGYLVSWVRPSGTGSELMARRIDVNRGPLDGGPTTVASGAGTWTGLVSTQPTQGSGPWVLWEEPGTGGVTAVRGVRLPVSSNALHALTPEAVSTSAAQSQPALTCDTVTSSSCLVAWTHVTATDWDIHAKILDSTGKLSEASELTVATGTDKQWFPRVVFMGQSYVVLWEEPQPSGKVNLWAQQVSAKGALQGAATVLISGGGWTRGSLGAASSGQGILLAWREEGGGSASIMAAAVDAALSPAGTPVTLVGLQPIEDELAVAWDSTRYLAVWSQRITASSPGLHGTRLDEQGKLEARVPFPLVAGSSSASFQRPFISVASPVTVLVWHEAAKSEKQIKVVFLRTSGKGS